MSEQKSIYELSHEMPFRVAGVVVLDTEQSDSLTDTCENMLEDHREEVLNALPKVHEDWHDEDQGGLDGEFIDYLQCRNIGGFLLEVETPVKTYNIDEDKELYCSWSWGCYTHIIVYGKTMDEALTKAYEWTRDYHSDRREEFKLENSIK